MLEDVGHGTATYPARQIVEAAGEIGSFDETEEETTGEETGKVLTCGCSC